MNNVLTDENLIGVILKFRSIRDNLMYSYIDKLINNCSINVIKNQLNIKRFFIRFKKSTIFPRTKVKRTYYTLKNRYIYKEETPLVLF
tara:strand:+ start:989 stop:1252 length:264 start_codon:yes stop_codon:yes gene_type:complete